MQQVKSLKSVPLKNGKIPGAVFINTSDVKIAAWENIFKRLFDVVASVTALIILSPVLLFVALRTKISSPGNIIYSQQRIGYKGKAFTIYKFRSMIADAEKNGPDLSSENDYRITRWGRIMRKWRLDELPQLWNILKGEMSFVGPRPERRFYINEINKHNKGFDFLLNVKPGLTSAGMVNCGYASSVDEMTERMQYDIEYVRNFSLLLDFKIMLASLRIILLGKGK